MDEIIYMVLLAFITYEACTHLGMHQIEIFFSIIGLCSTIVLLHKWIRKEHDNSLIIGARSRGVIIDGEHVKVYEVKRADENASYTDYPPYFHGTYSDFGEIVLKWEDKKHITISRAYFLSKVRKKWHKHERNINGKYTKYYSTWKIDPKGDDEIGLSENILIW